MRTKHSYVVAARLLSAGGLLLTMAVGLQVYRSSDGDFARDGWALLLPWVIVSAAAVVALRARVPVAIGCLAVSAAVALRFAGPLAAAAVTTPALLPAAIWGSQGIPREPWVIPIIEGQDRVVQLSLLAQAGACVLVLLGAAALMTALWRGAAGERRWDWVLVLSGSAFTAVCLVAAPFGISLTLDVSNLALYVTDPRLLLLVLSWVLPLGVWAVLHVGRTGRESVAGAAGVVVATVLVMPAVDAVAGLLGGSTMFFAYPVDFLPDYDAPASALLDRLGAQPYVIAAAAVLLLAVAGLRNGLLARRARSGAEAPTEVVGPPADR